MTNKTIERLLVEHCLVDLSAVNDSEGYDGGETLKQIHDFEAELKAQVEVKLNEAKSELNFALDLFESRRSFGLITDPEMRFLKAHGRIK